MNPVPIHAPTDPLPAPVAPTVHRSNKPLILTLVLTGLILLILVLFFTPLPYYQTEEITCKPGQQNCPQMGWNFAKPLYLSIFESLRYSDRSQITSALTPSPKLSEANPPLAETPTSTKTISSSKYGYRVKIPSDWNQLAGPPEDESLFNFRKGDYEISLSVIPTTAKTIQSYLEQADKDAQTNWEGQPSIRVISTKLTEINNLSAVRREEKWLASGLQESVINTYFLNQSILSFTLRYLGSDPNPAITETAAYDQVLSSLLFF